MNVEKIITGKIIKLLLNGEDYRVEVLSLIDSAFFDFAAQFFKEISSAKSNSPKGSEDWYEKKFLNKNLPKDQLAINSGLNMKTISNMFNSATREIVQLASQEHYRDLREALEIFSKTSEPDGCYLNWKFGDKSGEFSLVETFLIINTLAVKRAAIRGGAWSSIGKRVEKPLMLTLCEIFQVPEKNYDVRIKSQSKSSDDFVREIDFYLRSDMSKLNQFKCEVKLMGHGNPESADAVIARDSSIFVADKLSETNKKQLNSLSVNWVELRAESGFMRFGKVLTDLNIPHKAPDKKRLADLDEVISKILGLN